MNKSYEWRPRKNTAELYIMNHILGVEILAGTLMWKQENPEETPVKYIFARTTFQNPDKHAVNDITALSLDEAMTKARQILMHDIELRIKGFDQMYDALLENGEVKPYCRGPFSLGQYVFAKPEGEDEYKPFWITEIKLLNPIHNRYEITASYEIYDTDIDDFRIIDTLVFTNEDWNKTVFPDEPVITNETEVDNNG